MGHARVGRFRRTAMSRFLATCSAASHVGFLRTAAFSFGQPAAGTTPRARLAGACGRRARRRRPVRAWVRPEAQHRAGEAASDAVTVVGVRVMDHDAAGFPDGLPCPYHPGWLALNFEEHFAFQHQAECRPAGMAVRRGRGVARRVVHDNGHGVPTPGRHRSGVAVRAGGVIIALLHSTSANLAHAALLTMGVPRSVRR